MAREVSHPAQTSLDLMDIAVERNAYGRQIDSRIAKVSVEDGTELEAVFIRAPIITPRGPRRAGAGAPIRAIPSGWSRAATW